MTKLIKRGWGPKWSGEEWRHFFPLQIATPHFRRKRCQCQCENMTGKTAKILLHFSFSGAFCCVFATLNHLIVLNWNISLLIWFCSWLENFSALTREHKHRSFEENHWMWTTDPSQENTASGRQMENRKEERSELNHWCLWKQWHTGTVSWEGVNEQWGYYHSPEAAPACIES